MQAARSLRALKLVLVLALVLATALAACGDDGIPSPAEDKARAERVVLNERDVPGLTREDTDDEDDESDPSEAAFDRCLNNNPLLTQAGDDPRGAESEFGNDDESQNVASFVTFAENEKAATAALAVLRQPAFSGCFENALRTGLDEEVGSDANITRVTVAPLPSGDLGDESIAYRATVDLTAGSESATLVFDLVFIRGGRGVAGLFVFDLTDTFDPDERLRLSKVLSDRLPKD